MKQVLNLAKKLIEKPSTSDNKKALDEVLNICKKELLDFDLKEFEEEKVKSLLFFNTSSEKFKIIFNAHLDIVSAKNEQYRPFEKNNKLYGRGSYDMKTATACMILLFKELAKKVNYPFGLQLVTDEEVGGFKGTKYQIERGVRADFVIAGENTDLKINHKSKGIIWLKVKTKGISAHGAYPWLGDNAIWKMQKFLAKLEKLYPIPNEEVWCTTVNLSILDTSNKTSNKVPDECSAFLDIRYIPEDKDKVIANIEKLGDDFELEVVLKEPEHSTDESNPYIQKLSNSIREVTNKDAELVSKPGASDLRHYNRVGCDGVTFGIIGDGHHSDNEWADIKSVEQYYNILENFLTKI